MITGHAIRIGSWTAASRVAGYLRDMLMAQVLGATAQAEAFQIAFTFPNMFRNLFGEGAMNSGLIPHFAHLEGEEGRTRARCFLGDLVLLVGGMMLLISVLAALFMSEIMALMAWGFENPDQKQLVVDLALLCLPYLVCIILAAIFGGILNHAGYFSVPASAPIMLNLLMIAPLAAAVLGWKGFAVHSLAVAVVIGGVVQLAFCLLVAWKVGYLPIFSHRLRGEGLTAFFLLLLPGLVSALSLQVNMVVIRAFATTLDQGAVAWLFYAERLFQLPLALIGISLGVALLPSLSRAVQGKDSALSLKLRRQSQQISLLLALPASVGLAICSPEIINALFERGAFTAADTLQTTYALQAMTLGLPAYIFLKILQPLFFAERDTRTPMLIAVGTVVVNIVLAMQLMDWLAHAGLALASAVTGWLQVCLLLVLLKRRGIAGLAGGISAFALKIVLATAAMGGLLLWLKSFYGQGSADLSLWWRLGSLLLAGLVSYLLAVVVFTGYKWRDFKALVEVK